jgi:hypothetical protein
MRVMDRTSREPCNIYARGGGQVSSWLGGARGLFRRGVAGVAPDCGSLWEASLTVLNRKETILGGHGEDGSAAVSAMAVGAVGGADLVDHKAVGTNPGLTDGVHPVGSAAYGGWGVAVAGGAPGGSFGVGFIVVGAVAIQAFARAMAAGIGVGLSGREGEGVVRGGAGRTSGIES